MADEQLILDIAGLLTTRIQTAMPDGAALELLAFTGKQQVARGSRLDVRVTQRGDEIRSPVQMDPRLRPEECEQAGAHTVYRRVRRLELHYQLAPQVVRIVMEELLQVQHARAEPRQSHRLHNSTNAAIDALRPGVDAGVAADNDLLARVAHPGPESLQDIGIRGGGRCRSQDPHTDADHHPAHPASANPYGSFLMRTRPSCAVLATSRPSRLNRLARAKPRAPEALGLSTAYSNQSSTRSGRWNHMA